MMKIKRAKETKGEREVENVLSVLLLKSMALLEKAVREVVELPFRKSRQHQPPSLTPKSVW